MFNRMSRYPSDRKVYVGDLGSNAKKNDLEYAFRAYGTLRSIWIARHPPGFAFIEFDDAQDAADAVRGLDGRTLCGRRARVELSTGKYSSGGRFGQRRGYNGDEKCYECGGRGHYARECRRRAFRRSNSRSRSPVSRGGRSISRDRKSPSDSNSQSSSPPSPPPPPPPIPSPKDIRKIRPIQNKLNENGRFENEKSASGRFSDGEHSGREDCLGFIKKKRFDTGALPASPKRNNIQMNRRGDTSRD